MARVDLINLDGVESVGINVSKVVGFAGANLKDDVMLIQALFNYIAKGLYPGAVGLGGDYNIPAITGEMDADTSSAIVEFQIRNSHQLLRGTFDGRIHPGNYKNRQIKSRGGNKRLMSITLLHIMATDSAVMMGDYDYVQGLASLNPEVARIIDLAIIN